MVNLRVEIREFPFFLQFQGHQNSAKNLVITKNLVTKKIVDALYKISGTRQLVNPVSWNIRQLGERSVRIRTLKKCQQKERCRHNSDQHNKTRPGKTDW